LSKNPNFDEEKPYWKTFFKLPHPHYYVIKDWSWRLENNDGRCPMSEMQKNGARPLLKTTYNAWDFEKQVQQILCREGQLTYTIWVIRFKCP